MSPLPRLCLLLALGGLLQGCQPGLSGGNTGPGDGVTANAVAGDPIEVTALDDPPAAVPGGATAGAEGVAAAQASAPGEAPTPDAVPAPLPEQAAEEEPPQAEVPEVEVPPEAEPVPGEVKSEAQLACEKRKGRWVAVGSGALRACIFNTRDGGKQCSRESDCEEACLARSRTCAPFKPLFGCNDVLQDNGVLVTQCLE